MKKYVTHLKDLPSYTPAGHSKTTNYRLLGPGPGGSDRIEVVLGQIEHGGQADPHTHTYEEQAMFVMEGNALVETAGESEVVGPNDFIYLPQGTSHKVVPLKGRPLKLLIIYAPPLSSIQGS
ncbi:MAG: cupin domain-containing protein [Thermodesulfobacteriota bacterium]|nr:cupin domain-containing protein [Thermodesulfobacteriota bacterium]